MKLITPYLPETYIKLLDQLVEERFYPNRAEAIRISIRDLISEHGRFNPKTDYESPVVDVPVEQPHKQTALERLDELQKNNIKSPNTQAKADAVNRQ